MAILKTPNVNAYVAASVLIIHNNVNFNASFPSLKYKPTVFVQKETEIHSTKTFYKKKNMFLRPILQSQKNIDDCTSALVKI